MRNFITCVPHQIFYIDEVKEDEMGRVCSLHREKRSKYRVLVRKTEGKRPIGRPTCKWEDDIKMDLKEVG
jgi:hypothetical protein